MMDVKWFKGKRVTVFGIGLLGGGIGTIRFLAEHGARVVATDLKTRQQLASSLEQLRDVKHVEYILGQHRQEDFTNTDMVIKTPAAPWTNKHIKLALAKGVPVEVDAGLFLKLCRNPVIGVTGTKGKTTTSHAIAHILQKAGKDPILVGVGRMPVLDRLRLLRKNSVVVFELSSWRLSGLARTKMSPAISVFTNFFPDHLNYYRTMDAYLADKKNILAFQKPSDCVVYNADDPTVARVVTTEARGTTIATTLRPPAPSMVHAVVVDGERIIIRDEQTEKMVAHVYDLGLRGEHNVRNILCAVGAAYAIGVTPSVIGAAIKTFRSVPHRLELVRRVGGVTYYNDTAATNPVAAQTTLAAFEEPVILIAGGADKNLAYEDFARAIAQRVKGVVFLKGTATDKIIRVLKKELGYDATSTPFAIADSMPKAVEVATRNAADGDIVLLSPGAASFGLFDNEFDRGNQFKKAVESL